MVASTTYNPNEQSEDKGIIEMTPVKCKITNSEDNIVDFKN